MHSILGVPTGATANLFRKNIACTSDALPDDSVELFDGMTDGGAAMATTDPNSLEGQAALGTGGTAPDARRWLVLTIVCVAYFMTVLDVSIVTVALPSISRALNFSASGLQWVITAYTITFGGFLLLGGRCADLLGRRLIFMTGLAVFTAASLVCGLAGS